MWKMDNPFSSKEKGFVCWGSSPRASPTAQIEGPIPLEGFARNLGSDDPFSISELMNFDTYAGWCNSPAATEMYPTFGLPSYQPMPQASIESLNITEPNPAAFSDGGGVLGGMTVPYSCGDRMMFQPPDTGFGSSADTGDANESSVRCNPDGYEPSSILDSANCTISRPLQRSLDEKMLRALSLFKESSGGGILAQVWIPIKQGDQYMLTTSEQPYLLDQMLSGYREISRAFTFSTESKAGCIPGLPGRVFMSKIPEWTSNVIHYSKAEYLRVSHAVHHNVRGSIALPIFESPEMSCCAVLELVTVKEKPDFDLEMDSVRRALEAVNLKTSTSTRLLPECLSGNQRAALSEISDVLRAVCHAHRLPLALTWIPCSFTEGAIDEIIKVRVREGNRDGKSILCVEDSACYVNEKEMQGYVHACAVHYLEEGQGIAGKALQSNHPFFVSDVKTCDIVDYPLVHHARKFGLNAAVAIRLKSTYTGDDDYILEFFLPTNIKGSSEQQLLLNNLSVTMQRICKTLRTVADSELVGRKRSITEFQNGKVSDFPPLAMSARSFEMASPAVGDLNSSGTNPLQTSNGKNIAGPDEPREQVTPELTKQPEKRRSTSEKNVSLSVLQQYFSGSLKDAAKSIGVCPTTLKRICRQHGISRWPSRKINKVNRSLKKIQTVLDSVQGVEGGLKFDPATGEFVAAGSITQDLPEKNLPVKSPESVSHGTSSTIPTSLTGMENFVVKLEEDECSFGENSGGSIRNMGYANTSPAELKSPTFPLVGCTDSKMVTTDAKEFQPAWARLENSSIASYLSNGVNNRGKLKLDYLDCRFVPQSSSSLAATDDMDTRMEGDEGMVDHNHPTCSSMTDSSNASGSMLDRSSSSSDCFKQKNAKLKPNSTNNGSILTVKATYKEDTIRFKFEPSAGCYQLHEEVAKRFKLQYGTFQLKYLDDEEEWVMLTTDSDLQECLEIVDSMGTHSVKFLVRDIPCNMGQLGK